MLSILLAVCGGVYAGEAEDNEAEVTAEPVSVDERLDAILAETSSEDEYRESRRCLTRHDYRSVDILSQEYLLFRKGSEFWLNKLKRRCVNLRHDSVLTFSPRGTSSMCEGEQIWVTDRFDLNRGFTATGIPVAPQGTCVLGEFEAISADQAALLRDVR